MFDAEVDTKKICQTPSIPRKGTETSSRIGSERIDIQSDTLNSPQGDGNTDSRRQLVQPSQPWSDTLNSPQGDGNFPIHRYFPIHR